MAGAIRRIPGQRGVLCVLPVANQAVADQAAARIAALYADVPGVPGAITTTVVEQARAAVLVMSPDDVTVNVGNTVVWGLPFGARGPATEEEISAAVDDPHRALALTGIFVLAALDAHRVRLVTSSSFAATLRRSGDSFATRALPALAAAGRRPQVDSDALVDVVSLQYPLGDSELFREVEVCPDASVVDV